VGFECKDRGEYSGFRHLNFLPLLKLEDTFVVREQREGETMALLRHRWCWLSPRHSTFLFRKLKSVIDFSELRKDDLQAWCQVCFYFQHVLAFIGIFLARFSGKLFRESILF